MSDRSLLALAAAVLLVGGCNKPSPTPSAAVPDTGAVDTVAAAGAPIADSTAVMTDSVAVDSTPPAPADSLADTTAAN